jgi:hypothetical protein
MLACLWAGLTQASPATPRYDCETLAARAGAELGLPAHLLPAIARVESGTRMGDHHRAWPWTVNQAGRGSYHPSPAEALARVETLLAEGISNIDLGCMQINWRWHHEAFDGAAAMLDPRQNTRYAARYLRDLYDQHGDWGLAVAQYHSRDPDRGRAYAAKVALMQDQISDCAPPCGAMQGLLLAGGGVLIGTRTAARSGGGLLLASPALPLISASN